MMSMWMSFSTTTLQGGGVGGVGGWGKGAAGLRSGALGAGLGNQRQLLLWTPWQAARDEDGM